MGPIVAAVTAAIERGDDVEWIFGVPHGFAHWVAEQADACIFIDRVVNSEVRSPTMAAAFDFEDFDRRR